MKQITRLATFALLVPLISAPLWAADDLESLKKNTAEALENFKKTDSSLGAQFDKAAGYVVFPRVGKGGFVIGGAHGDGLVYDHGKLVGKASLSQASIGAQIGGQVFREVVFFETADSLSAFKESKFEMSAQVGAVAAAEGAAKNAKYSDGVLVFTQPVKGLMAEASVGGQKFKYQPLP
jgi:lipid-binding SYLF domain-containing protein